MSRHPFSRKDAERSPAVSEAWCLSGRVLHGPLWVGSLPDDRTLLTNASFSHRQLRDAE